MRALTGAATEQTPEPEAIRFRVTLVDLPFPLFTSMRRDGVVDFFVKISYGRIGRISGTKLVAAPLYIAGSSRKTWVKVTATASRDVSARRSNDRFPQQLLTSGGGDRRSIRNERLKCSGEIWPVGEPEVGVCPS